MYYKGNHLRASSEFQRIKFPPELIWSTVIVDIFLLFLYYFHVFNEKVFSQYTSTARFNVNQVKQSMTSSQVNGFLVLIIAICCHEIRHFLSSRLWSPEKEIKSS